MSNYQLIKEQLNHYCENNEFVITDHQYDQINQYYDHLLEWNKVMNLTAITSEEEFAVKHILDSVLIHQVFSLNQVEKVIDIGTGAGLPGIPLKILFPHINITLLDSLNKRIHFLEEVVNALQLENVELIHGRAEDFGRDEAYREMYDLTVSRAVSQLPVLTEYCLPFVKESGYFIAYKSIETNDEINSAATAIDTLGGVLKEVRDVALLDQKIPRRFVMIEKVKKTPEKYPRKAGKPQKKPL